MSKLNLKKKYELAEKHYMVGLELLKQQKPKHAIVHLLKAIELDQSLEKAKIALEDAKESIKWTKFYFCPNCGRYIRPEKEYPELKISQSCTNCNTKLATRKELLINLLEISAKMILFGILPILILIFCGMPYVQHNPPFSITVKWSPLPVGIVTALTLTPGIFLFLILINDQNAYILGAVAYAINSLSNPFRFIASTFFLYSISYTYFFLIFTPILTMHRKGLWRNINHQKKIILSSTLYTGLIIAIRTLSGIYY